VLAFPAALGLLVAGLFGAMVATADVSTSSDEQLASVNALAINGGALAITAVSGRVIEVLSVTLDSDVTGNVTLRDGAAGGTVIGVLPINDATPSTLSEVSISSDLSGPGIRTTAGNGLYLNLTSATVSGVIRYRLAR
jgi:hypothetical protein